MAEKHERVFSIYIDVPAQRVWEALTTIGSVQSFYFDSVLDTELKPGAPLKYRSTDGKHVFLAGEVLELSPPRRFSHTFQFCHLPDPPSRVTFDLQPEGPGTKLTVLHDQFDGETKTWKSVARGWPSILKNLKSVMDVGRLPLGTRFQYALMKILMPLMPKRNPSADGARA